MAGSFGFELDLGKSTDEEKEYVKKQIADFHKYSHLIHNGDYYRLTCSLEDTQLAAWEFVARDKSEALLNAVTLDTHGNPLTQYIRCKGLNPDVRYAVEGTKMVLSGKALMNAGIPVPYMAGEYQSWQVHLIQVSI
jgi:alpha-galactosidase